MASESYPALESVVAVAAGIWPAENGVMASMAIWRK